MKWEVDLEARTIEVRRSLSEPRSGRTFVSPKGGKGRQIRLAQSAVSALKEHRKRQLEEKMRLTEL